MKKKLANEGGADWQQPMLPDVAMAASVDRAYSDVTSFRGLAVCAALSTGFWILLAAILLVSPLP